MVTRNRDRDHISHASVTAFHRLCDDLVAVAVTDVDDDDGNAFNLLLWKLSQTLIGYPLAELGDGGNFLYHH